MINEEIARIFERMAKVLAFKGEDRFRIMAYERAAVSIRDLEEDLSVIAQKGKLEEIPGIGKDLSAMISEYVASRKMKRYERECRGISSGLIELMNISGLGPKTLALLHKRVRISNFKDLKRALDAGALLKLKGFGQKKIDNIKRGIDLWLASQKRMLIGVALPLPLAENLLTEIRKIGLIERAEVAGSLRRRKEDIGDMDVLIISQDGPRVLSELTRLVFLTWRVARVQVPPSQRSTTVEALVLCAHPPLSFNSQRLCPVHCNDLADWRHDGCGVVHPGGNG